MNNIISFVTEKALVLIPVLFVLRKILKETGEVEKEYIPSLILTICILFAFFIVGFDINGLIQGILATGASIYINYCFDKHCKENR